MKFFLSRTLSLAVLTLAFMSANAAIPIESSLAPMLHQVLPSVVNIRAEIKVTDLETLQELQKQRGKHKEGGSTEPGVFSSVASGVIVDAQKGFILTNAHVVADAQTVTIILSDGHHYTAKILGIDKPSDVALLQIHAKNLTAMTFANSNEIKVGDFVAAIGNPFGLNQTVTSGIISGVGRTTLGIESYENFIQTDASINPGNSGGALINMKGQLLGLNTAILAPDRGSIGIGFAIPANMAKSVMLQLLEFGNVKRGVLGVGAQDITPELASAFRLKINKGAAITQVLPNSAAQQSGILVGDIITAINGIEVKTASDVVNTIGFLRVDSKINISVLRNNKPIAITVTLSDTKKRKQLIEQQDPFFHGVGLKDISALSPIHGKIQGVLVVSVERDSNSWHSDLRPGDIITSINQEKINQLDELKLAAAKPGKELLLNVLRGPSAIFLVINKEV